jgi:hypothetical protein
LRARGRRSRLPWNEHHDFLKLRDLPRRLRPLGGLVGAQADARKQRVNVEAGLTHHFGDGGGVGAVRPRSIRHNRAGRGGKRDQHPRRRFNCAEAGRDRLALKLERQRTRCIEDDDLCHRRRIGERAQHVEQADALDRDVAVAVELRVNRDQVIVAFKLDGVAVVVNEDDRIRTGGIHLREELAKQAAHVAGIDIGAFDDLEPDAGQRLRHQSAVGERDLQRALRISGIADDKCDALLRGSRLQRCQNQRRERGEGDQELA